MSWKCDTNEKFSDIEILLIPSNVPSVPSFQPPEVASVGCSAWQRVASFSSERYQQLNWHKDV